MPGTTLMQIQCWKLAKKSRNNNWCNQQRSPLRRCGRIALWSPTLSHDSQSLGVSTARRCPLVLPYCPVHRQSRLNYPIASLDRSLID